MSNNLPPPVNHIFVDFENVHSVNPAVFAAKTVHLTLLLGAKNTTLKTPLVEMLLQYAANVELVRLSSSGRNALDFTLAYYLGRAVLADPRGYFHIVSKDAGYDPLVEYLRSKHINVHRHDDFSTLTFSTRSSAPAVVPSPPAAQSAPKPKLNTAPPKQAVVDGMEQRVLEYLRRPTATLPRTLSKLTSFLVAHFGHKVTEIEALALIENLGQAGHLFVGEKGKVTYHLSSSPPTN